jgi:hypothetical protein
VEAEIPRRFANKDWESNAKDLAQDIRGKILGNYTLRNFLR